MSKERASDLARQCTELVAREIIFRRFGLLSSKVISLLMAFRGKDWNATGVS